RGSAGRGIVNNHRTVLGSCATRELGVFCFVQSTIRPNGYHIHNLITLRLEKSAQQWRKIRTCRAQSDHKHGMLPIWKAGYKFLSQSQGVERCEILFPVSRRNAGELGL